MRDEPAKNVSSWQPCHTLVASHACHRWLTSACQRGARGCATTTVNIMASGGGDASASAAEQPKLVPAIPEETLEERQRRLVERNERNRWTWNNVKQAWDKVDMRDVGRIERIPCARDSLLTGIGAGTVTGSAAFFLFKRPILSACNWAVVAFCGVAIGAWEYCTRTKAAEYDLIQKVMIASKEYEKLRREQARLEGETKAATAGITPRPPIEVTRSS